MNDTPVSREDKLTVIDFCIKHENADEYRLYVLQTIRADIQTAPPDEREKSYDRYTYGEFVNKPKVKPPTESKPQVSSGEVDAERRKTHPFNGPYTPLEVEPSPGELVDRIVAEIYGDSLSSEEMVDVGNNIYLQLMHRPPTEGKEMGEGDTCGFCNGPTRHITDGDWCTRCGTMNTDESITAPTDDELKPTPAPQGEPDAQGEGEVDRALVHQVPRCLGILEVFIDTPDLQAHGEEFYRDTWGLISDLYNALQKRLRTPSVSRESVQTLMRNICPDVVTQETLLKWLTDKGIEVRDEG